MRREDDLRAAMMLLAGDPPTVHDVTKVVTPSGDTRRGRLWILPAAAAILTLAVVLTVTALVSGGHSAQPPLTVRKPPTTPTALVGRQWILVSIHKDGASPRLSREVLFIRRDGRYTVQSGCGVWAGQVRFARARATLSGAMYVDASCTIATTSKGLATSVTESVLNGSVRWSLRGSRLTIAKPGVGWLTFARHAASAMISGRLLAIGGPAAGDGRPLAGTVTVTTDGRKPLTVAVGSDGRYSVTVAPGTYQVQGHSPQYESGKWPCRALKPADAAAGTATTADVYCEEK